MSSSSSAPYALERAIAISAVERACSLTDKVFRNLVTADTVTKKDKSPVTVGDYSAQAVVNAILGSHFPDDPIVGEEDSKDLQKPESESLRNQIFALANEALKNSAAECPAVAEAEASASKSSALAGGDRELTEQELLAAIDRGCAEGGDKGRCWALDPIDGTKGFLRGGQYAVCLGFMVDGKVQVGVMGCPNLPHDASSPKPKEGEFGAGDKRKDLGTLFIAVRGQGAYQRRIEGGEEQKISMRSIQSLSEASFCESVEAGHSSHGTNARIAELLGITAPSVRMDSQAKYASLSRGDGDVYLRLPVGDGSYIEKIWDHAAGSLLVEEAGGRVSDIRGKELNFGVGRTLRDNRGVVASHKDVHAKVIDAVRKALDEEGRGHL
ncbi:3(2),5-bisphosphate nucleotidase HAL2 [Moesziomyces antarcticus]|uniref:3'(2'),5'-bisphosphate nucleotidase n=1 Tax=Pseudozyma antarctica TaxID=84753 RepID=A0A5C3FJY6_PSEA2|nr:3(2),5-bisphosphate nucleotidase HAL2 [Moesziomyces antarcticus]GAK63498.1 3(2),5-bisphosphate nucleotidase HAL2 [Moesziomyces antarcticus]SPO44085.1 probable MET22 - protein ser/thr phosphatase [Moesziomyces antarcticus]